MRPPVGWAAVAGSGAIAGIGFTASLLIANLAFSCRLLEEAKIGILAAAAASALLSWTVYRTTALLPKAARNRAVGVHANIPSRVQVKVLNVRVRLIVGSAVTEPRCGGRGRGWTRCTRCRLREPWAGRTPRRDR
ncbi:Na+/H+ antiporter NhaA [Streptomyces glomeratus]|uniref:Uncharacterized protein n=1 Tax=Streptomyces glomeratus TaxID=284452 RepID=A0ABP6LRW8_9ACTN